MFVKSQAPVSTLQMVAGIMTFLPQGLSAGPRSLLATAVRGPGKPRVLQSESA